MIFLNGLDETHRVLREVLLEAQEKQKKYAGRTEITFEVGYRVWLLTRQFRTNKRSKKLDSKRAEPYTVGETINKNAYKLDLPKTMRNQNMFLVSLLDRYTPPTIGQPLLEPPPVSDNDSEEWEVDQILDSKPRYQMLHYQVQWAGYSHVCTSWEPAANLENTRELVKEFNRKHPGKPH